MLIMKQTGRCMTRGRGAFRARFSLSRDVFTDLDVMTAEEIETLPIYTRFLAKYGLGWFASTVLSPDAGMSAGVSVQRARGKPHFSTEELRRVENLARHIERSLRLSIRFFDAENLSLGMREILSRMGIGVFAVDARMKCFSPIAPPAMEQASCSRAAPGRRRS